MKPLLRFCSSVVKNGKPLFIPVRVDPNADQAECFENVRVYVAKHGGAMQHGWAIWEWPKVYWEAEFHCVWKSPHGELIDITPNNPPYPWIMFLPDPLRVYRERLVNNIRKPLIRDALLTEFQRSAEEWHRTKKAKFEPGFVETPELLQEMKRLMIYRRDLSEKMRNKFGSTLIPAMRSRMISPMPKNEGKK